MSLDFYLGEIKRTEIFWQNITHNVGPMAEAAGIYDCLWHPNENGFILAKDIIEPLEKGLADLRARPEFFSKFNATNKWGTYEDFVPFVEEVLRGCKENPDASICVSV